MDHSFRFNIMFLTMIINIITFSIFLTVNSPWLYYLNICYLHVGNNLGLNHFQLMHVYFQMIGFIQIPWEHHFNLIYLKSSMKAIQHFKDVKRLILFNHGLMLITFPFSIHFYIQLMKRKMTWLLISPCQKLLSFIFILLLLFGLDFNDLFIAFHRLMFRNLDWVFNSKADPIINALPNSLFFQYFMMFFGILLLILVLIVFNAKHDLRSIS
ncbi:membrane protein [Philodulcilactobacillus myokoensis]|uniref:Membrane protein n=1 Tax=Philodulcilactobacillus myokoensis TaxID=2929573 RepID=A0A9W6B130_9LACO|nr:TIGR01906 family membrane protein [Philodulcilactobacillus myokoensis]GLB46713.1 membrane protein [Philodulcilactobacillus myokoensis]